MTHDANTARCIARQRPETCLIEVLADLRPDTRMLADLDEVMGEALAISEDLAILRAVCAQLGLPLLDI